MLISTPHQTTKPGTLPVKGENQYKSIHSIEKDSQKSYELGSFSDQFYITICGEWDTIKDIAQSQ